MKPSNIIVLLRSLVVILSSVSFLPIIIFTLLVLSSPHSVWAVDVTLAWDANGEDDLAGYRICHRQNGANYDYDNPSWEGTNTTCTVYNLDADITYHFVARAFDEAGNKSGDCDEVTYHRPPVLNTIGAKRVDENSLLTFTVTASDPDGDGLTYSASNVPTGASFNAASQTFGWTPGYGAAGNYTVTFTVTDNGSPVQSDSEEVTITVSADVYPPADPVNLRILGE
jgi:hypothetical protein